MTAAPGMLSYVGVSSALGLFVIGADDDAVRQVLLPHQVVAVPETSSPSDVAREAARQLEAFLHGERTGFDVPRQSAGTDFQEAVWSLLDEIPYGEVRTYGWVADGVGRRQGARAAGQALGRNPIPVLRSCHRVVAAHGLGGYGGAPELKARLLEIEGVTLAP